MSRSLNTIAVAIAIALCAAGNTATAQTLVGHWALDETGGSVATDGASGNNGTWQNGVSTNLQRFHGHIGLRAANLIDGGGAGANNFFQIPGIGALNGANGLSISVWVDPDAQTNTGYNGIFMTRAFNAGGGSSWGVAIENGGGEHFDSRTQNSQRDSPGGSLSNSAGWHHMALVWDGVAQTHTQYINGVQSAAVLPGVIAGPITAPTGPWMIGYDPCCGNTRDFDGVIDDASVWTGALSSAQVSRIYQAGLDGIDAASALSTSVAAGPVQAGLVGSWNMDQPSGSLGAADSINDNDAILANMDIANDWVPGQVGRALDFDGGNDEAVVGRIAEIAGSTEMTISLWVRNDGGNENNEGVFQHRDPTDLSFNQSFHGLNTPSGGAAANDIEGRVNRVSNQSTGANSLPVGDWTHVVQVFSANNFNRVYIDGQLAADITPTSALDIIDNIQSGPNGTWRFGNDICCGNRFFDGAIDDAGLWNRAVSPAEIEAIRQAGLNSISHTRAFIPTPGHVQDGLVGHWTFDQARFSPAANDSIGNADATLTNMDSGSDWIAGQAGGALRFDGGNDQAIISGADAAALNGELNGATELTMSLWVNADSLQNNNEGLFQHRGPGNANLTGFNTPGAGLNNFDFRLNSTSIKSADNTLQAGQWMFLTGVWAAGDRFELWIDGELSVSGPATAGPLVAVGDWRFGEDTCCGNRFFEGALDDAGIWSRALSGAEIRNLFAAGLDGRNLQQVAFPEPASAAMLAIGGATLLRRRRDRQEA